MRGVTKLRLMYKECSFFFLHFSFVVIKVTIFPGLQKELFFIKQFSNGNNHCLGAISSSFLLYNFIMIVI